jgi:hypothetical protein
MIDAFLNPFPVIVRDAFVKTFLKIVARVEFNAKISLKWRQQIKDYYGEWRLELFVLSNQ